ncbi:uncharacterized protein LOC142059577 isoform X2 [Phalacrocorax aristotelis]|uniref:uncharacterized protein LOC142059577 isoform X2 n=1 Tax=Phalacrocorax aristotelis TaxID=126867 RepID=UPI003F4B5320
MMKRHLALGGPMQWADRALVLLKDGWTETLGPLKAKAGLAGLSRGVPTCDRDLCRGSAVTVRAGDLFGIGLADAEGGVVQGDGGRRCKQEPSGIWAPEGNRTGWWASLKMATGSDGGQAGAARRLRRGDAACRREVREVVRRLPLGLDARLRGRRGWHSSSSGMGTEQPGEQSSRMMKRHLALGGPMQWADRALVLLKDGWTETLGPLKAKAGLAGLSRGVPTCDRDLCRGSAVTVRAGDLFGIGLADAEGGVVQGDGGRRCKQEPSGIWAPEGNRTGWWASLKMATGSDGGQAGAARRLRRGDAACRREVREVVRRLPLGLDARLRGRRGWHSSSSGMGTEQPGEQSSRMMKRHLALGGPMQWADRALVLLKDGWTETLGPLKAKAGLAGLSRGVPTCDRDLCRGSAVTVRAGDLFGIGLADAEGGVVQGDGGRRCKQEPSGIWAPEGNRTGWWASLKMATGSDGGQAGAARRLRRGDAACRREVREVVRRLPLGLDARLRGRRGWHSSSSGMGTEQPGEQSSRMMKRHLALGGPMQWADRALVLLKDGWTETLGPLKAKAGLAGLSRGVPTCDRDLCRGSAVTVRAGDLFGIGLADAEGGVVQGDGGRRCKQEPSGIWAPEGNRTGWWASLKMATGSDGGQAGAARRLRRGDAACRREVREVVRRLPLGLDARLRGRRGWHSSSSGMGTEQPGEQSSRMMKRHLALGGPMQWADRALVLLKDGWTETLGPLKAKAGLAGLSRGVPTCDRDLCRGSAVTVRAGDLFGIGLADAEGGVVQGDGGRRCKQEPSGIWAPEGNRTGWWASLKMATGSDGGQAGAARRLRRGDAACRREVREVVRRLPLGLDARLRGRRGWHSSSSGMGTEQPGEQSSRMMKRHLALGGPMQWADRALVLLKDGWTETLGPLKAKAGLAGLSRGVPTCDRDLCRGSAVTVRAGDLFGIGLADAEGGVVQGDGGRRCKQEPSGIWAPEGNRTGWWASLKMATGSDGGQAGAARRLRRGDAACRREVREVVRRLPLGLDARLRGRRGWHSSSSGMGTEQPDDEKAPGTWRTDAVG